MWPSVPRARRWRRTAWTSTAFIILDYNPSFSNDHWVSELNHNPVYDESRYFFKTTYLDNPYLSKEQREAIEVYRLTDKRLWKIYGEGEQCMAEGLVFDTYFVCDEIPEHLKRRAIVGVGLGLQRPLRAGACRHRPPTARTLPQGTLLQALSVRRPDYRGDAATRMCRAALHPRPARPRQDSPHEARGLHVRLPKTTRIGGKTPIVSGIQKMKGLQNLHHRRQQERHHGGRQLHLRARPQRQLD